MRALSFGIGLTLCVFGLSFAQAAVTQKTADHHQSQAARLHLPRASPAALRRCALSHKILNAASRSACKGHPLHTG
jgi:type II secretory pathway component PulL